MRRIASPVVFALALACGGPASPGDTASPETTRLPSTGVTAGWRVRAVAGALEDRFHAAIVFHGEPRERAVESGATEVFGVFGYERAAACFVDPMQEARAIAEGADSAQEIVGAIRDEYDYQVCDCDGFEGARVEEGCLVCECTDSAPADTCVPAQRYEREAAAFLCPRILAHHVRGNPGEQAQLDTCQRWGLVRAHVGADGAVTALHETALPGCALVAVESLERVDVDGDGAREVVIRARSRTPTYALTGDEADGTELFLGIYRDDLTSQLERTLAVTASCGMNELMAGHATRVVTSDEDADGHADLVIEEAEFSCAECGYADDGWVSDDACARGRVRSVWRYDTATDGWTRPDP